MCDLQNVIIQAIKQKYKKLLQSSSYWFNNTDTLITIFVIHCES